ncbi:MAG: deoxyribose-phosphate aldolase [Bradyrhizobiaceae bacterium]|nr:deoxyribose-phosphate aldolase [Bradyrhizobiaceae bacterium]
MNALIDHTLLKPDCTADQIRKLCAEATEYAFASVCVLPWWVELSAQLFNNVCTVVGFPLGANTTQTKVAEAVALVRAGAREIDMVASITALKSGQVDQVRADITAVVDAVAEHGGMVKVIIETCLLTHDEKLVMCDVVSAAGAAYIKTSTGFSTGGATLEDVALLRKHVSSNVKVKASGGIRDRATAQAMAEAGASRIGTSSGIAIVQG